MRDRLTLWAMSLLGRVREIRDREDGQAVVEYGVLLALILVVAIGVIALVGTDVKDTFQSIVDAL